MIIVQSVSTLTIANAIIFTLLETNDKHAKYWGANNIRYKDWNDVHYIRQNTRKFQIYQYEEEYDIQTR